LNVLENETGDQVYADEIEKFINGSEPELPPIRRRNKPKKKSETEQMIEAFEEDIKNSQREFEDHPLAAIFPLMEGEEFKALEDSIRKGWIQGEAITIYEGKILDGRNRYRAAKKIGFCPRTKEYEGNDPEQFVIAQNLHRRHLTPEQKIKVAEKRRELVKSLKAEGKSTREIARATGVSQSQAQRDVDKLKESEPPGSPEKSQQNQRSSSENTNPSQEATTAKRDLKLEQLREAWNVAGKNRRKKFMKEIGLEWANGR